MNHVNLIGKFEGIEHDYKELVTFKMSTSEIYMDDKGNTQRRITFHPCSAKLKHAKQIRTLNDKQDIAIEGGMINQGRQYRVLINDLVIL